jgi:hypothetical protein
MAAKLPEHQLTHLVTVLSGQGSRLRKLYLTENRQSFKNRFLY